MTEQDKLKLCKGCRDDHYNQPGNSTTGRCWSLKNAKVVTRYRIGWWTQPTQPGAFTEVVTLDCHHATGRYAHYDKLPDFAKDPVHHGASKSLLLQARGET